MCRFGAKVPLFPWGTIRGVLIEHEIKMDWVMVLLNGVLVVNSGVLVGNEKSIREECEKKEIHIEITIGNGKGHSECVTTELNDRVLKHYMTFCTQSVHV